MFAAAPTVPVAVKLVLSAPAVAVSVFAPTAVPSVQEPTVATPLASVVAGLPVTLPSPEAAKLTLTPATGFPYVSVTVTDGAVPTDVPTVAVCPSPTLATMFAAAPTVPVAVNDVLSAPTLAVSVFAPTAVPRVHEPTVATPLASVVAGLPVTLPSPEAAKLTLTPATGFPYASVTVTAGAVPTAAPTVAVCPSPALTTMFAGAPTVPVAENDALSAPALAVSVFAPTVVDSVHDPTVATPLASVVAGLPVTLPSPEAAKLTLTPDTGFPYASVTVTAGATATAVPTAAV